MRDVIHAFKYHNYRALSQRLASLMAGYFEQSKIPGEVLVPVPLHNRRLRERGYNQSGLLAHELGKRLGIPVAEDALRRIKDSSPQVRAVSAEARRQNVEGAFVCERTDAVKERGVIVVDDVCTSGATLDACARALKIAGARSVWGLTFARECE